MPHKAFSDLFPALHEAAYEAGKVIMSYYKTDLAVEEKDDGRRRSKVTRADREADALIVERLRALTPDIPIVSEEGEKPDISGHSRFWLVDALDGTNGFTRGDGSAFTVNIALIEDKRPVLGVIYDPQTDTLYWGAKGEAAFRQKGQEAPVPIRTRVPAKDRLAAIVSNSHLSKSAVSFLDEHHIKERVPCASSIKFCYLAEGKGDVYPRFGETSEWDTAAGQAILEAAGGRMTTPDGGPFLYGKGGFRNGGFIATGGGQFPEKRQQVQI